MGERQHYRAAIIGAGQAGGPLSTALAGAGWRTALIERAHIGGTCINEGCTPTKTMVASGEVAYLARHGADFGVRTGEVAIDMGRVRQRKREIVDSFRGGGERRILKAEGLDWLRGEAHFTGPHALQIAALDGGTVEITAEMVIINAGCRPTVPPLPGIEEVGALDSTSIMELDAVPEPIC